MDVIMVSVVSQVFMITVLIFIGFYALIITLLFRAVRDDKKLADKRTEEVSAHLQEATDRLEKVGHGVVALLCKLYEEKELASVSEPKARELCSVGAHSVALEKANDQWKNNIERSSYQKQTT